MTTRVFEVTVVLHVEAADAAEANTIVWDSIDGHTGIQRFDVRLLPATERAAERWKTLHVEQSQDEGRRGHDEAPGDL